VGWDVEQIGDGAAAAALETENHFRKMMGHQDMSVDAQSHPGGQQAAVRARSNTLDAAVVAA